MTDKFLDNIRGRLSFSPDLFEAHWKIKSVGMAFPSGAHIGAAIENNRLKPDIDKLLSIVEAVFGKSQSDINSVENVLALMVEGEGDDVSVYQRMAKGALERLRAEKIKSGQEENGK